MEVAGLVLGAIPIAIKALLEYRSFLSSLKNAQRNLDSIIRRLRAQQHILENTCETLLMGLVSPSDIETMIKNPCDPLWAKHAQRIELRLDQDWGIFQDTTREMTNLVKSLQAKLELGENGKLTITNRASLITALKEKVRFTLRSKDYNDLIAALNEGNNTLRLLVLQSKDLEPSRQSKVRTRLIRTVQQLTKGIYTSLCASVTCHCALSHGFGLHLTSQKTEIVHVIGEHHITKPRFGIAFGTTRTKPTEHWEQLNVSLTDNSMVSPSVPLMPQDTPWNLPSSGIRPLFTKRAITAVSTMTYPTSITQSSGIRPKSQNTISRIGDLCSEFGKETKSMEEGCFGFITDKTSQFYLSHKSSNLTDATLITLREILYGESSHLPRLDYGQKARIAFTLSSNLLPLVTTPWLEKVLNPDEITFFRLRDGVNGGVYHLDRMYLTKDLGNFPAMPGLSCGHPNKLPPEKYKPPMILSLACLLVQIIIGDGTKDLEITESSCWNCLIDQGAAALQNSGAVLAKGSHMYAEAVNWCLKNYASSERLEDGEFHNLFYSEVVAKLEALMDIVESSKS